MSLKPPNKTREPTINNEFKTNYVTKQHNQIKTTITNNNEFKTNYVTKQDNPQSIMSLKATM